MNLFQAQVYLPNSDEHVHVAEALMVIATPIINDPQQEPAATAFILSVTGEAVRAEAIGNEGGVVFATLRFDGQRFILVSEGHV